MNEEGSPLIKSPMSVFWRDGGIFISSTLKTLSTVANMFSILAFNSFIRSCAVRKAVFNTKVATTRGCETWHLTCSHFQTFFLKLLNEECQSALSHLPAQPLFNLGISCVSSPPRRHLVVLSLQTSVCKGKNSSSSSSSSSSLVLMAVGYKHAPVSG